MRGFVVAFVLGVIACHAETPQQQAQEVARAFCDCYEPGDSNCEAGALQGLAMGPSQACLDCVDSHVNACAAMLEECVQPCFQGGVP
jgi:hypothetical protein